MHSSAHNDVCFVLSVFSGECSGTRSSSNGVYSMTYAVNGDTIRFTVQAQTTGWVGIGFSLDQLMVSNLCVFSEMFLEKLYSTPHLIPVAYVRCGCWCSQFSRFICV